MNRAIILFVVLMIALGLLAVVIITLDIELPTTVTPYAPNSRSAYFIIALVVLGIGGLISRIHGRSHYED